MLRNPNRRGEKFFAAWPQDADLSRIHAVGKGSVGRRPAVLGGSPSTFATHSCCHLSVTGKSGRESRRRAGDDGTRAACGPNSSASLRLSVGGSMLRFMGKAGVGPG